MPEINLPDVIQIVLGQMAQFSDSGKMLRNGVEFFDTQYELIVEYNTFTVRHIIFQEEGFVHWRSGQLIDINKGFISKKTAGQLNAYGWSMSLGIPFNMLENDQILLEDRDKMLEEIGATYRL